MEKVFLSYTYRPHQAHETELERLRKYVIRAVEAMGLRVLDGVDVGGRPLDDALRKLIRDADALIALITPQTDNAGNPINPAFVVDEFQYAEGAQIPTMRVIHSTLNVAGLGVGNEYTPYHPGRELDVILKLLNTIAIWRRDHGRRARVRIEPQKLAEHYDEQQGDKCEFQVISREGVFQGFERAKLWLEPGAAYAMLPKLREGERVRLLLRKGNQTWRTRDVFDPFVAGVSLEAQ